MDKYLLKPVPDNFRIFFFKFKHLSGFKVGESDASKKHTV